MTTHYCTNCDSDAVKVVVRRDKDGRVTRATLLCQTCADAFEMGQASPDAEVLQIEDYEEER